MEYNRAYIISPTNDFWVCQEGAHATPFQRVVLKIHGGSSKLYLSGSSHSSGNYIHVLSKNIRENHVSPSRDNASCEDSVITCQFFHVISFAIFPGVGFSPGIANP